MNSPDYGNTSKKRFFGISQKLSVLILLISVVPLLMMGITNYIHNMKMISAESENLLTKTAEGMAGQINEWIDKNLRTMIFISRQPEMQNMDAGSQEKILKAFQNGFPWIYLAFTVDKTGMNIARNDGGELKDYGDRSYFREVMAGKPFAFETLIGKTSKKPALVMAVPLKKGDEIVGVLGAAMNIDMLSATVATWKNGKTGFAFMVDACNKVLSHPEPGFTHQQKNMSDDKVINAARSGKTGRPVSFIDESGTNATGVGVKISGDWILAVRQNDSEIFASATSSRLFAITVLLVTIIISVMMAIMAGRSISKPVLSLADAANRMSLGEMDVRIDVNTNDEIGILAEAVSRLQTSLKIAIQRLKK